MKDQLVEERVDKLLREHDPSTSDPETFLGAQFDAGLALVSLPIGLGGLGLERRLQQVVDDRLRAAGAKNPLWRNPIGIGMGLPTVNEHGSDRLKRRYFRSCFTGAQVWCQLFSEPGAGSDLAGLSTRAVRDGECWIVDGQKVWTSLAHRADVGLLLARTDPEQPKHKGLSFFLLDMHARGVDVRPLREMTGETNFNEVFLSSVRVGDDHRVGDEGAGWLIANTMLANERTVLSGSGTAGTVGGSRIERIITGAPPAWAEDRVLRDRMMRRWSESQVIRWTNQRSRVNRSASSTASVTKLFQGLHNRMLQDLAMDLHGLASVAWADGDDGGGVAHGFLRAQANTIEGGSSNVLRNVIGEKLLGLPRESGPPGDTPWSQLLRNG
jgi:alkylation response protein AidB-like acyl-CoA dehydrogenase